MKLLIVSHTEHYRQGETYVGWGATVREIDHLAMLFDEVVHVAPLHPGPAPESAIPYHSPRVALCPVHPAGGKGALAKLGILSAVPTYVTRLLRELKGADVVHVRCPANISLMAITLLALARKPRLRWAKYAGSWQPYPGEAWSYAFQRWWLGRGLHRGVVTVNGHWPHQPKHIHSFVNPCLTDAELTEGRQAALNKRLSVPVRILYVGRLETAKGVGRALDVMVKLGENCVPVNLDLVGDGPERSVFEQQATSLGLQEQVTFHGWLPRLALDPLYTRAHIILLPSSTEGWPKVLSEAMAYGAVPVCSNVSSIPQYLAEAGTGRALDPLDIGAFADAIMWYSTHPDEWQRESEASVGAAAQFTYANYLQRVQALLGLPKPVVAQAGGGR